MRFTTPIFHPNVYSIGEVRRIGCVHALSNEHSARERCAYQFYIKVKIKQATNMLLSVGAQCSLWRKFYSQYVLASAAKNINQQLRCRSSACLLSQMLSPQQMLKVCLSVLVLAS